MKKLRLLVVASAMMLAEGVQAQFILTLNCTAMDPYIGKQFEVRVTEIGSDKEVGRKTISMIESADFSIELYSLLRQRSYNVDFYADVNENWTYDTPQADHAWRRIVNSAMTHVAINFTPDTVYTDTGFPEAFPYINYNAVWGGKWMNETFGSTDSIQATFKLTCDSVIASVTTKGVFGNPDVVTFNFADTIPANWDPANDTISFSPPAPWTGVVRVFKGDVEGDIALFGTGLQFTGTVGAQQTLALYTVLAGGFPFANGYFYVQELQVVSSAPPLEITLDALQNVSCAGGMDGAIDITPSGGTPGYTYIWSTGSSTEDITGLPAGHYSPTVTDINGCSVKASYTITEPDSILVAITTHEVSCPELCDGSAIVTVAGGVPPYTYNWSTGTTEMNPFFCTGDFTVTVTDMNGCTAVGFATINSPAEIIIDTVIVVDATNGQSNGSFDIHASGGTPPLAYSIDGVTFQSSPVFTNLPSGSYIVFIMDANGCMISAMYEILLINAVDVISGNFRLYPNPATSYIYLEADTPLSIEMLNVHGIRVRSAQQSLSHTVSLDGLARGVYVLIISNGQGKAYRKLIVQ